MDKLMYQQAPWPEELEDLVSKCRYRPGWTIRLVVDLGRDFEHEDTAREKCIGRGTTLIITTQGFDSYHPERGETYRVQHYRIVPAATYNRRSWRRWLFEQFLAVEQHEAMEFFTIDGERPFAPHHGAGEDPYTVLEHGTNEDVRTSFRGEVKRERADW